MSKETNGPAEYQEEMEKEESEARKQGEGPHLFSEWFLDGSPTPEMEIEGLDEYLDSLAIGPNYDPGNDLPYIEDLMEMLNLSTDLSAPSSSPVDDLNMDVDDHMDSNHP